MADDKKRSEFSFHFSYVSADSQLIANLADSIKKLGSEVISRTFQEREYSFTSREQARFLERAAWYLKGLDDPKPITMEPRLFVSYAREDYHFVRNFAQAFNKRDALGVKTWIDAENIIDAKNWMDEVLTALTSSWAFVLFLSRHTQQITGASAELHFILERMKRRSGTFFCVALLDKIDAGEFRNIHLPVMDLYKMSSEDAAKKLANEMIDFFIHNRRSLLGIAAPKESDSDHS